MARINILPRSFLTKEGIADISALSGSPTSFVRMAWHPSSGWVGGGRI
ncbi:MAG: hypothetical protein HY578_00350 [Nitrospinae bacterium]|nr:hypothetical protein [Nitrospinota bacterium]